MKAYKEEMTAKYFSLEESKLPQPISGETVKIIITYKNKKPQ